MPIYCTSCIKIWTIASTTFTHGTCPYCGGITKPTPPMTVIKRVIEEMESEE